MKQFIYTLVALMALTTLTASAESVDWYFTWTEDGWGTQSKDQFETTETENVYVTKSVIIGVAGINFNVHNSDWSTKYGWKENVTATDTWFGLTLDANASWAEVEAGTYDIYFNSSDETIKFVKSDDNTTAISNVAVDTAAEDEAIYNLQGVRLESKPQKGIYIKGGKKYVAK